MINLIRKNNYNTRLHTFGIGSGASTYLVKETAKAGLGKSHLVPDNDTTLNEKVIQTLKLATKAAYTSM